MGAILRVKVHSLRQGCPLRGVFTIAKGLNSENVPIVAKEMWENVQVEMQILNGGVINVESSNY